MSKRGTRRYCLTLNNPTEAERASLTAINPKVVTRGFVADEVGSKKGVPHFQGFIHLKNAKSMPALKKFLGSNRWHFDKASGTDWENFEYCRKENTPFITWGDEPTEEGDLSAWEQVVEMVKNGFENWEIIERFPGLAVRCQSALDKYRLELDRKDAGWRDLTVTFITGPTECGKTRSVMETYGYSNVYRITDKKHPWDTYAGQDVVIFEEFRSSFDISDMLNWLDGYPVELPARYANKLAKFTKVFILSNESWESQYEGVKERVPETFRAWDRRVHFRQDLHNGNSL